MTGERVRCFLLERVNERIATRRWCDGKHGGDEGCNENEECEVAVFDVRRIDTGEIVESDRTHLSARIPGAMWLEDWELSDAAAPRRILASPALHVILPNGNLWVVDSRAANCTMPEDNEHRCWVRTGEPPNVTAGKDGPTCSAGAGSIQSGDWHGFLRDGELAP